MDSQLSTRYSKFFSNILRTNPSVFYFITNDCITGVEVGVISIILSGTILKWLFSVILTVEIVMRKSALKIGMIPQKLEWLESLLNLC